MADIEASLFTQCSLPKPERGRAAFSAKTQADFKASDRRLDRASPFTQQTRQTMNDNIFSGLKVVDFASFIAGPAPRVILSDFGADVIKVEPPSGDIVADRTQDPPAAASEGSYPFHLATAISGPRSRLKSPSAQQILERLVKWADVLIVNTPQSRPQAVEARIR